MEIAYFFEIKCCEVFFLRWLFKVDGEILLVVESDAFFMLADTLVADGLNEVDSFIDNDFVFFVGIFFIFKFEVVLWECLDGEIGGTDGTFLAENIGGFGNTTSNNVINVWFVGFHF